MSNAIYKLTESVPEIGGRPGDYVVVRPGHPEPLSLVRKLRAHCLPHLLPYLEELEPIPRSHHSPESEQSPAPGSLPQRSRRRQQPGLSLHLVR
jgi:hypothetical protein